MVYEYAITNIFQLFCTKILSGCIESLFKDTKTKCWYAAKIAFDRAPIIHEVEVKDAKCDYIQPKTGIKIFKATQHMQCR